MADVDSNLPIYSRATSDPVIVSKDTSANSASNVIFTQLSDGSTAIGVTSGALDVNVDNASFVVTATDLDIRDLVHTQDSVSLGDGTSLVLDLVTLNSAYSGTAVALPVAGRYQATPDTFGDGDATQLLTDENGRLQVDIVSGGGSNDSVVVDDTAFTPATSSVTAVGYFADETATDSVDEGDVGAARMTLDRKQLMVLADATTDSQRLAINASGEIGVVQATHDDLNANVNIQVGDTDVSSSNPVPVSKDGSANAETNPIFVQVVSGVVSGIEVIDYQTSSGVAPSAFVNHDYTVTGSSTLKVQCVYASSSGIIRAEVLSGPVAGLATAFVGFSSHANPNIAVDFKGLLEVPDTSTGTLRVRIQHRGAAAFDVYSTMIGTEV